MRFEVTIKCSTVEDIDADNFDDAREQANTIAEEIGAYDIGIDKIRIKKIKRQEKRNDNR